MRVCACMYVCKGVCAYVFVRVLCSFDCEGVCEVARVCKGVCVFVRVYMCV